MNNSEKKEMNQLSKLEKIRILQRICQRCLSDNDRLPEEVIKTDYKGNSDAYIQAMLKSDSLLRERYRLK